MAGARNRLLFWLAAAALLEAAAYGQVATLDLRLMSQAKLTAARVYITGIGGAGFVVPGTVTYSRRAEEHSIVDGTAQVPLSPGTYWVRVEKGPEFAVAERQIELAPVQVRRVEIDIPRLASLNAEGWYSGDMHIHRAPAEMPLLLRAEELNVGPVITRHVGAQRKAPPYPETDLMPVDDSHVIGLHVQEVERNFQGHGAVVLFNFSHAIPENLSMLYPTVAMLCRQAKSEGAFIDAEKPMWKHVPMSVAFGLVDSIGVVNNHFHPHDVAVDSERIGAMERDRAAWRTVEGFAVWMMDLYYSFLNCGYRIAASAGSASGVMADWPGYERVYVHLSGPFSYGQWFRDLKAGHSFATNGPLLRVSERGHPPGSEVEWQRGMAARLEVRIDSQNPLDRLEVVWNGKVVRTIALRGARSYRSELSVAVPEPGWLAVRCFEPVGETLRYAHTSPFYFPQNGKLPVHAADARRWARFVHGVVQRTDPNLFPSREEYNTAIAEWKQAEEIYRKLEAQAGR